jgi:hypothetical protein
VSTGLPGFDGKTETAMGVVRGIRSWTIYPEGLRGSASGLWISGENIADCSNEQSTCLPPVEDCGCGFWAYWQDSARFFNAFNVAGVVEGYGRTLIGPRGFRSEKARIVALTILHSVSVDQMITVQGYDAPLYPNVQSMLNAHPLTDAYSEPEPEKHSTSSDDSMWISVGGTYPGSSYTYATTYTTTTGGSYWPIGGSGGNIGNDSNPTGGSG